MRTVHHLLFPRLELNPFGEGVNRLPIAVWEACAWEGGGRWMWMAEEVSYDGSVGLARPYKLWRNLVSPRALEVGRSAPLPRSGVVDMQSGCSGKEASLFFRQSF